MGSEGFVCGEEEDGWREGRGKGLVCIPVLQFCFLVSVLIIELSKVV